MPGRPTDYTSEIVSQAWDYIGTNPKKNYESHEHAIPSVVGMCRVLNRSRTTLYDWAKSKDNSFSYILPACKELQEFATVNGTLKNELNSNIGKLILGKHGYHDKQDVKQQVNVNLTDLTEDELNRKLLHLESLADQEG